MHIEDLAAPTEVSDHVENLFAGLLQHLCNGSLAKVQAVIWTVLDRNKLLQSGHCSKHSLNTSETLARGHAWILRMARDPYFVLFGHRDHALEKIRDAFPICVRAD